MNGPVSAACPPEDAPAADPQTAGQRFAAVLNRLAGITPDIPASYHAADNTTARALRLVSGPAIGTPTEVAEADIEALKPGWAAVLSWTKRVLDVQTPEEQRARLVGLSPYEITELLGRMVDDGVTCTISGERWFAAYCAAQAD